MYIYENHSHECVSVFLDNVHKQMQSRFAFFATSAKEEKNAQELENFLQRIKTRAKTFNNDNFIENNSIDLILKTINQHSGNLGNSINNLFRRKGGINLENDLSNVIRSVYQQFDIDASFGKGIHTGGDYGTTLSAIVDDGVKNILKDMGEEIKKTTEVYISKTNTLEEVLPKVQRKTDVQGAQIQITLTPTAYLEKMLIILNQATFTAKNYSISNKKGELIADLYDLHIGDSNPYRSIMGVLEYFGYSYKTSLSAFCAAYHENNFNTMVGTRIYQLRYAYELSGIGMTVDGGEKERAKYLIYNEPDGDNLYVRSTASLILEVLNDDTIIDNPFKAITIKRRGFKK